MKIVCKPSVYSQILDEIIRLNRGNKIPDYIVVSPEEHKQLCSHVNRVIDKNFFSFSTVPSAAQVEFKTWELKLRSGSFGPPSTRVTSQETINGLPLLVVPESYRPL